MPCRRSATGRLALVRDDLHEPSFLVMLPVYSHTPRTDSVEARRAHLVGFILGVFRIQDLVDQSLTGISPKGLADLERNVAHVREELLRIVCAQGAPKPAALRDACAFL